MPAPATARPPLPTGSHDWIKYDDAATQSPRARRVAPEVDDAPVVRFVQSLLTQACSRGASDVHVEPYDTFCRVRFRVDGALHEVAQPPMEIRDRIVTRIKVLARLDIAERRIPQDGRMTVRVDAPTPREVDIRVSTLPTVSGEKVVLRLLPNTTDHLDIDQLGYEPSQKTQLLHAIGRPHGMVLVTGPTGSGKTVSLYTCLQLRNRGDINIVTAEDPAEIRLAGINQININDKVGLSFAAALRAMLRQDPDIIMVGEIRDFETADIAIKAAQTGHLVFSTLHTNDAPATLTRLLHMGVAPFHLAAGLHIITAQRLARRLCTCKRPASLPREALHDAGFGDAGLDGGWQPYRPVGCESCGGTGYRGRCGIHQVMPVTEAIQRIILSHGDATRIAAQARHDGVLSLREAGLLKVRQGVTSLDEVLAITVR
ncbi:type IV pilus assembly protein PilB [Cupriavidus gilardii J11]|uniref:Type IV pilus assembly protein PilB n=1 Tax=Cupriavidus gilardii J11 TaxID=936133 RepID=A0A562B0P7_9BURK|nr:type IV pilus assembly protein PilB [Cupriavidus gilardii J11]